MQCLKPTFVKINFICIDRCFVLLNWRRFYLLQNNILILLLEGQDFNVVFDYYVFYIWQFYFETHFFRFWDEILGFQHLFVLPQLLRYLSVLSKLTLRILKIPIECSLVNGMFGEESVSPTVKFRDEISKNFLSILGENPLPELLINAVCLLQVELPEFLVKILSQNAV